MPPFPDESAGGQAATKTLENDLKARPVVADRLLSVAKPMVIS